MYKYSIKKVVFHHPYSYLSARFFSVKYLFAQNNYNLKNIYQQCKFLFHLSDISRQCIELDRCILLYCFLSNKCLHFCKNYRTHLQEKIFEELRAIKYLVQMLQKCLVYHFMPKVFLFKLKTSNLLDQFTHLKSTGRKIQMHRVHNLMKIQK